MGNESSLPRAVPEIREAIALFEAWERSVNDLSSARRFTDAVLLLDDYLECEPQSPHRIFIRNLRLSNTRTLLRQLAQVDKKDFSLWLEYAVSVLAVVDREAGSVITANPGLQKDLDAFLSVWGDAIAQALKHVQNGES